MATTSLTAVAARGLHDSGRFAGEAHEQLRGLAYGVPGFARDYFLWTWLRARGYARHSLAIAADALARLDLPREGSVRASERFADAECRWRNLVAAEGHVAQSIGGEWVAAAIEQQLSERDPARAVIETIGWSRHLPEIHSLTAVDDHARLAEVLRLRGELRMIALELEVIGQFPARPPRGDIAPVVRGLDKQFSSLVRDHLLIADVAGEYRDRFFLEHEPKPWKDYAPAQPLITRKDVPWLSGEEDRIPRRNPWWT